MPLILLTNDDSIFSPGLKALEEALSGLGDLYVVAPDTEKSAVSFTLTIQQPLRVNRLDQRHFAVSGTPTDCAYLGIKTLLPKRPDFVVSGINLGANLGEDTIYSGTVAGAFQSSLLGVPALAVSAIENREGEYDFTAASRIVRKLIPFLLDHPLEEGKILSVNVPFRPKGVLFSKLGHKRYDSEIVEKVDPRGKPYYWIGPGHIRTFGEEESDVKTVEKGYASVAPLSLDFCDERLYEGLKKGEENLLATLF